MKRALVLLALLSLFVMACPSLPGTGNVTETNVTMSEVSGDLAQYEGNEQMDILAGNPVLYNVTGNARYDSFFRDAAVIYATQVTAQGMMDVSVQRLKDMATRLELTTSDEIEQLCQTLIENRGSLSTEDVAELNALEQSFTALADTMVSVPENGQTLVEQVPSLIEDAPSEFQTQPTALGTVQESLNASQENLTLSIESAPALMDSLRNMATAIGQVASAPVE